eukprot:scaffold7344_cov145-Cylindrotheca_fusiformis.AAC.30
MRHKYDSLKEEGTCSVPCPLAPMEKAFVQPLRGGEICILDIPSIFEHCTKEIATDVSLNVATQGEPKEDNYKCNNATFLFS